MRCNMTLLRFIGIFSVVTARSYLVEAGYGEAATEPPPYPAPARGPPTRTNYPAAAGNPFSNAVRYGDLLFLSGQLGMDKATKKLAPGGFEPEFRQTMNNVKSVLADAGSSMDKVVKVTVLLNDIKNYELMNTIYKEYFTTNLPARVAFQVAALPLNACVELELIAA